LSKIKLLLEVVNDMRSLADSIQAVCDAMTEGDPAPSAKAATEQEPVKEPDIPLEKVRMVLAEKSQTWVYCRSARTHSEVWCRQVKCC
jgi:hypothetical protein